MHYYQFNIADYRKDTQHLTPIEHYIYRELMDWAYLDECCIPENTQLVLRRLRLGSEYEQELENVLEEYFYLTGAGWEQKRISEELELYYKKAETARVNGSKGGRPKKPRKTQPVILANPEETQSKANQEPLTSNHNTPLPPKGEDVPYKDIFDLYHNMLPNLPAAPNMTDKRIRQIKQRWHEKVDVPSGDTFVKLPCNSIDFWERFFKRVQDSPHLLGRNDRQWKANLEWLTKRENFYKVIEGVYVKK